MDNTFGHFVDTSPRATLSAMRNISDVNVRLLFFIYNCFSNIYSFKPILCTYIHFVKGIPILTIVNRALVSRRLSCECHGSQEIMACFEFTATNQYSAGGNL